ncbi:MAG: RluA family pseudouridine synthase [Gammaproteobacteria bacterium]|nr:MAG: RluA family pseudouridine synthase [Gammaproteobacteria bacterium]
MTYSPPPDTGLDLIYEDEFLLVLNKPSGLLSVPGKGAAHQDSLATRVQMRFSDALIIHRLDMPTSGILLMARNQDVHRLLSKQFASRQIKKAYVAVVDGLIKEMSGSIDLPLICDWPNRPRQKVDYEIGKPSLTHYSVLAYDEVKNTTRVRLEPITGRSHQLRVHLQSIGHAILGDKLYASETVRNKADRLLLHASLISFMHPVTDEVLTMESAVPF